MIIFKLREGQQVCFYCDGNMIFCTCSLVGVEKEFHFEKTGNACSYYYDNHYVGRIICQGYRIYDEKDNMILEEGKCIE